jgi:hypothetical protein
VICQIYYSYGNSIIICDYNRKILYLHNDLLSIGQIIKLVLLDKILKALALKIGSEMSLLSAPSFGIHFHLNSSLPGSIGSVNHGVARGFHRVTLFCFKIHREIYIFIESR